MIGTTIFLNAIVKREDLTRVWVIRLCSEYTRDYPPYLTFPKDLAEAIKVNHNYA